MRSFAILLVSSLFSLVALADTYQGTGSYKSNGGEEGEYSIKVDMSVEDDTVTINQSINFEEQVLTASVKLRKVDDTFYDVLDADTGDVIGSGYCWTLKTDDDKVCHSYSKKDDYVVELTIKAHGDYLYSIGSYTDLTTGDKVTWSDMLQKSYGDETVEE